MFKFIDKDMTICLGFVYLSRIMKTLRKRKSQLPSGNMYTVFELTID